jgi:hypothetical protein
MGGIYANCGELAGSAIHTLLANMLFPNVRLRSVEGHTLCETFRLPVPVIWSTIWPSLPNNI